MFQSCYCGFVSLTVSSIAQGRLSRYRGCAQRQSGSVSFDVADVLPREPTKPRQLNGIDDIPALAHAGGRVSLYQASFGQGLEVPVKAGAADVHRSLEAADGRRAKDGQMAQNLSLSPTANYADRNLNLPRKHWSNEVWHASILPDVSAAEDLHLCPTLLLSNKVGPSTAINPS